MSAPLISGRELRAAALARGVRISKAQFDDYAAAGLLGKADPVHGWPITVLERLLRVSKLGATLRPLDRRVIVLRDPDSFPVTPEALRAAMVSLIPRIGQPARKLHLVAASGRSPVPFSLPGAIDGQARAAMLAKIWLPRLSRPPKGVSRRLPGRPTWVAILLGVDLKRFDLWTPGWYAMVSQVIPAWYAPRPNPLAAIPFEEQVVLYAVLDIYGHKV